MAWKFPGGPLAPNSDPRSATLGSYPAADTGIEALKNLPVNRCGFRHRDRTRRSIGPGASAPRLHSFERCDPDWCRSLVRAQRLLCRWFAPLEKLHFLRAIVRPRTSTAQGTACCSETEDGREFVPVGCESQADHLH